jgi:hypothetical protein
MADHGINDANHWRDRATEMRVLSSRIEDLDAQRMMLKLANDYDKLADAPKVALCAVSPGLFDPESKRGGSLAKFLRNRPRLTVRCAVVFV